MKHPYQKFIQNVEKPARYIGGEYLSIKKDWESTPIKICLTFPDLYEIGMSHMGMKILYSILNKQDDMLAERAYTPWFDMEEQLRKHKMPIYSMESIQPLESFDILGFSLQYEMTYTNVLTMLDLSGLPLRAEDRGLEFPLVIAGGPCAVNPEPMSAFIDCFVVGDGEAKFPELARAYKEHKDAGKSKTEILVELAKLGGIYCPALYNTYEEDFTGFTVVGEPKYPGVPETVTRTMIESINDYPFPYDSPVPMTEVVFDRTTMEIARGCTEGCRFCQAGMIYRPVREREPQQIIDSVLSSIDKAGYDESSLTSLSTADFSCVSPLVKNLMKQLKEKKVSLSVSSLRAYGLTGDLLDDISDVRNTSLTFAPEAGTQRMRDVINKNVTEEDITQSAHNIFARGWRKMKLYFMIGLPTEEDEDVLGIVDTAFRMLNVGKLYYKRWKMLNVTASVSSFVPKPHTPFQWCQMDSLADNQRKQAMLKEKARELRVGLKWHEAYISHIEGVVSRGDRKVGKAIEIVWNKGARFDGWGQHLKLEDWLDSIKEAGLDINTFFRTIPLDSKLPWGHIDVGVELKYLKQEYKRSVKDRLSPPCGKPFRAKVHHTNLNEHLADERKLICYDCGVACDMKLMREERSDYLIQLNSIEKPEILPNPEVGEVRSKVLDKFVQGDVYTYRAEYTKLNRSQYMGHSDVIRMLPRIIRRAGLEACYSQGYHPKPIMAFGPALSLGIPSFGELLDFQLLQDIPQEEVLSKLNQVCPEGVRFNSVQKIENNNKELSKKLNGADWLVGIHNDTLMSLMQVREGNLNEILNQRIEALLQSDTLVVERTRKGSTRDIDIRPMIGTVKAIEKSEAEHFLSELLWEEGASYLHLHMQISGTNSVKPEELMKALFGHDDFIYDKARLKLKPYISSAPAILVEA